MHRASAYLCATVGVAATLLFASRAPALEAPPWRPLASSAAFPPALALPIGVFDEPRRRVFVIETDISQNPTGVRVLDLAAEPRWSILPVGGTPPGQQYLESLVLDPARDRLLVIGTESSSMAVWALSLTDPPAWQKLATSGNPPARWGHSTILDPVHDRIVMFGGLGQAYPHGYLQEAWALPLAGGAWTRITANGVPPVGREGHGALYDPERQRMLVFGGHYEDDNRHFLNDVWELGLGDTIGWSEIQPTGKLPGSRSAFATVYDPARRRLLVHGGIHDDSGVEPDELWALSLDGVPAWTRVVTADTLVGCSYRVDVYDPVGDRLVACGGSGVPGVADLSLSNPVRWRALMPTAPLVAPSHRRGEAVVFDERRGRFLVFGGGYSAADSAQWRFNPEGADHWQPRRAPPAPPEWFFNEYSRTATYDSLGDRLLLFDGGRAWTCPASEAAEWHELGPPAPIDPWTTAVGAGAAACLDSRRNRLLVSGGWYPYAHSAGFTRIGVWALSLGAEPSWSMIGSVPQPGGSAGHASFYDPIGDRLLILGGYEVFDSPRTHRAFGAVLWASPLDSVLQWTRLGSADDALLAGPPNAFASFNPRTSEIFLARDSMVWRRPIDDVGPWNALATSTSGPVITSAIACDPVRDQLLALFAAPSGSDSVQAWAIATGPLEVTLLATHRSADAIALDWRSVSAYGCVAAVERREEASDWSVVGPLVFEIDGRAAFVDHDIREGHDYYYRVRIEDGDAGWNSESAFVPDPGSLRVALFGARPNPAAGGIALAFSLPAAGPARLELFDVRGRRCMVKDVGGMGPGMHTLRLDGSATWRPGVYFARLERGNESRTVRVVLMR